MDFQVNNQQDSQPARDYTQEIDAVLLSKPKQISPEGMGMYRTMCLAHS